NVIWSILEEKDKTYWFGTDKGLCRYREGKFKTFGTADGLVNESVFKLMKDTKGNIWIGTMKGLSIYSSGKFTNYTVKDGLPDPFIATMAQDSDGTVWIGTGKGLCRFSKGKITPPPFNVIPHHVEALLTDRNKNLWYATLLADGLRKVKGEKQTRYTSKDGLVHNRIRSLFEDSRGRIWIGTNQGLSCFHQGKFTNYSIKDGLPNGVCYSLLEDNKQNIWIGTAKGVSRFNGKTFKNFTSTDGLIYTEMNIGAGLKDSQGRLWFGTYSGISCIDPALIRKNTVSPPVFINDFYVLGKNHPISNDCQLEYYQNHLKFDYIGLCFTSPEDVKYKYRLEGINRDWMEIDERNVSYQSLPPGKYVFKVIAKNNDGIESLKPAEFPFQILPPFWQTWWFR
ncbi:MAG: hypothetical protein GY940_05030, partial [bacterium]|nr:hypothetical protein [bacterium]